MLHRPLLVYRMPNLMVIDGIPVSEEERVKAEMYFIEQQVWFSGINQTCYNINVLFTRKHTHVMCTFSFAVRV